MLLNLLWKSKIRTMEFGTRKNSVAKQPDQNLTVKSVWSRRKNFDNTSCCLNGRSAWGGSLTGDQTAPDFGATTLRINPIRNLKLRRLAFTQFLQVHKLFRAFYLSVNLLYSYQLGIQYSQYLSQIYRSFVVAPRRSLKKFKLIMV
jgi:hypothetical protein